MIMRPRVAVTHRKAGVPHPMRIQMIQVNFSLRVIARDLNKKRQTSNMNRSAALNANY